MRLTVLEPELAVCRLAPDAALPGWVGPGFSSVTRTHAELSVVCEHSRVPEGIRCEGPWRCLEVAGPLAFSEVGIMAALSEPLASAGVSLFAVSTFDTDYLLVKSADLKSACEALRAAGNEVSS
ncbi:MAG: ACT domain-containing protein [Pseudomonadota bacterium]